MNVAPDTRNFNLAGSKATATIGDSRDLGGNDFITVATSTEGKRLTKRVELDPDGGYKIVNYDEGATWFSFMAHPVSSLADLAGVLDGLGPHSHIVNGRVRDGVDASNARRTHVQHPPTLQDWTHHWHPQDFDKIPAGDEAGEYDPIADPERAVRQLVAALPPEFHGAACHWRLSSSAGFKAAATINMRLFFWLDRPLTAAEQKDWLDPYIKEGATKKVKTKDRASLDGGIYTPSQPIYCAPPELEAGITDPVPRRSGLIAGGIVCVPAADAEREVETDGAKRREKVFREKECIGRKAKPGFVPDNPIAIDDVIEYLRREAPAVEGENGDPTTVLVANRCGDLGVNDNTAHRLMLEHWNTRCRPPWQAEGPQSLRTKVGSAYRSRENQIGCDADQPAVLSFATPLDTARRFARRLYTDARGRRYLVRYRGDFYTWTGTHYRPLSDEALEAEVFRFLDLAVVLDKEGNTRPFAPDPTKVEKVKRSLRGVVLLGDDIDAPAWLPGNDAIGPCWGEASEFIPCRNGLLHFESRLLLDHEPAFFGFNALPFDYDPNAPQPVEWFKFLDTLWGDDPASIRTLRELFGYFVSGRADLHKIFLLVGPPRSGKGTILRIITALLGSENVTGAMLTHLKGDFGLQAWIGKAAALIPDARVTFGAGNSTITERLLAISGGDHVSIPRKNTTAWEGKLPTRIVIASNEAPGFDDASGAIATRFVVLLMTKSFLGHEDVELEGRLLAELPGIFNWALAGLARLTYRGHFVSPRSSRETIDDLKASASPIQSFVAERCGIGAAYRVEKGALFEAWKRWCENRGFLPGSSAHFAIKLRAAVPGLENYRPRAGGERMQCYAGITLRRGG